jgi:hypothetical protein
VRRAIDKAADDRSGLIALEYWMIATLVAVIAALAVGALSGQLQAFAH